MLEFDYFRKSMIHFMPKTPTAALRAFQAGLVPIEEFVHKATSIRSLNEEPYDIKEIERVLSIEDLDIDTQLLLIDILNKLVKNEDAEVALFAAESINSIESRHNKMIQKLKRSLKRRPSMKILRKIANLYYELSLIYKNATSIRNFYLKEASYYIMQVDKRITLQEDDIRLFVKILLDLKLYDQAIYILKRYMEPRPPFLLFLEAEVEYNRKNFEKCIKILRSLTEYKRELDNEANEIIRYWLESV
jgi:tetratricopeptide (TPR) repeat protein